ncbi:MAG: hypothetical protein ABH863_02380 [Candidatus Micrarchaeota archaeon]
MLNFLFLDTRLDNGDIIRAVKDYKAISIRPELAALGHFVKFCHGLARKDFANGENAARDFALEWICRIACTRNIKRAAAFCDGKGGIVGIVSEGRIPEKTISVIGKRARFRMEGKTPAMLAKEYSLPERFGDAHLLQKMLVEKTIVSFFE